MFRDLSIRKKLSLAFGSTVIILLVLLGFAYRNFALLSDASHWNAHTQDVLLETSRMNRALLEVQTAVRGFALSGNEQLVDDLDHDAKSAHDYLQRAIVLTADNPTQQARLRKLEPLIDNWLNNIVKLQLQQRRAQNQTGTAPSAAVATSQVLRGSRTLDSINTLIDQVSDEEQRLLRERTNQVAALRTELSLLLSVGGGACALIAIAIGAALARAIVAPLNQLTQAVAAIGAGHQDARVTVLANDELGKVSAEFNRMAQAIQDAREQERAATAALRAKVDALLATVSQAASGDLTGTVTVTGEDAIGRLGSGLQGMFGNLRTLVNMVQKAGIQVTTSATEIAASAKQQEATGIEQAQTSIEVLATTREISANTQQLLKAMQDATGVAEYTTHATGDAQSNIRRMDDTMGRMVAATDAIGAKLAALSEKAANINSVLTTITKVADQTNILSLNAAIEAEKAGEAGRGFAVVATEIRRLADQTSVSTWDIEQMLKEMQSAVSASVMGMDKFAEEIRRSVDEVRQVAEQLSGVMDQVQKLAPQFDLVLQGMQSQAVGAQQITETMNQLNDATQQTVESLKATSEAVHQLQYAATDLQTSVANFALAG
jgi:methyl-accepting chemotaxis protein WspA